MAAATHPQFGERPPGRAVGSAPAYSPACTAVLCGDQEPADRRWDVCEAGDARGIAIPAGTALRSAVLCVPVGFGVPDAEDAQSVVVMQQALDEETAAGFAGQPTRTGGAGGCAGPRGPLRRGCHPALDGTERCGISKASG
ncbi:hypothetical protein ACH47C_31470 [Streptomyces rishiriensis]|uniref:hypothetical protein n=1 Tax=Streptomyces rishiriensis TaxID=68264 RepID=UPI0033C2A965